MAAFSQVGMLQARLVDYWRDEKLTGLLALKAVFKGSHSTLKLVMSGDSQRSVLGPVLFNSFTNDLEKETECALIKFVDHSNLEGAIIKMLKDRVAI